MYLSKNKDKLQSIIDFFSNVVKIWILMGHLLIKKSLQFLRIDTLKSHEFSNVLHIHNIKTTY